MGALTVQYLAMLENPPMDSTLVTRPPAGHLAHGSDAGIEPRAAAARSGRFVYEEAIARRLLQRASCSRASCPPALIQAQPISLAT